MLVVDDDEVIREVVASALEDEGYTVSVAGDGLQALADVRREPPDGIVLDLMMPRMNGWEFVAACRREPRCGDIPIVVMSAAHNLPSAAEQLLRVGVRACVAKPFDLDALLGVVERLVPPAVR